MEWEKRQEENRCLKVSQKKGKSRMQQLDQAILLRGILVSRKKKNPTIILHIRYTSVFKPALPKSKHVRRRVTSSDEDDSGRMNHRQDFQLFPKG